MQVVHLNVKPIRDGEQPSLRYTVQKRRGTDLWTNERVIDVTAGTPEAQRAMPLDNDERIVVEPIQGETVVYDPTQMAAVPRSAVLPETLNERTGTGQAAPSTQPETNSTLAAEQAKLDEEQRKKFETQQENEKRAAEAMAERNRQATAQTGVQTGRPTATTVRVPETPKAVTGGPSAGAPGRTNPATNPQGTQAGQASKGQAPMNTPQQQKELQEADKKKAEAAREGGGMNPPLGARSSDEAKGD